MDRRFARIYMFSMLSIFSIGCSQTDAQDDGISIGYLENISEEIGMKMPADTEILITTDGGGREPSKQYYAWVFRSRLGFNMPSHQDLEQNGKKNNYLDFSSPDRIKTIQRAIEAKLQGGKIVLPQSAFVSEWSSVSQSFRGSVIKNNEGEYLAVERFRK